MAKISKPKIPAVNPRSRAAKRATSPSIDVDKSIKEAPRALGTSSVLGVTRNSGISKKKKTKNMTRGQRARQEKGLARAEAVMDQMEKKKDGARAKLRKVNNRKAQWEDVNEATAEEQRKNVKMPVLDVVVEESQRTTDESKKELGEIEMASTNSEAQANAASSVQLQREAKPENEQTSTHAAPLDDTDLIT